MSLTKHEQAPWLRVWTSQRGLRTHWKHSPSFLPAMHACFTLYFPIFGPIYINFSPFFPPFLIVLFVCFQLSNGYYHCSLPSGSSLGPVGVGSFPHIPSVSHAWTRATSSTLLPDYAHYYTIGPGMLPSPQIPSWKVCVTFRSC